ncbi:MAG: DciA family protein [Planctomycetota bacterium]|jgi:predicted nucleic acid-binding Zn ribbon protein
MDQGRQQRTVVQSKPQPQADNPIRLGQMLQAYMAGISPKQARFSAVKKIWTQLLPAELQRHCRITDISGGQLKIEVDLPAYIYELKLCSSELLEQINSQCPRAGIKQIKFSPARPKRDRFHR